MSPPSFSSFRRRQIIFEVKYDPAYGIWDRAGLMARQIERNFDKMEALDASPDKLQFILDDEYVVSIGRTSASVTASKSNIRKETIIEDLSAIYKIVEDGLHLETLNRIGFRHIFVKAYDRIDEAIQAASSFNLMKVPRKKAFGVEPVSINPHYKVEFDNEIIGVIFQLYAATRSLNINFTPDIDDFGAKVQNEKLHELSIDVDFFTKKPTDCDSFLSDKHLSGWYRAIQNGVEDFLRFAS